MEVARLSAITRGEARTFVLRPGHATTLGRSSSCTVPLRDRKVSRVHCQLTFDQGHVVAVDLDSRHGLLHLGERKPMLALRPGDGFHLGETFVRFVAVDQVDDATVAAWFAPGGLYAPRPADGAEPDDEDAANDDDEPARPVTAPPAPPAAAAATAANTPVADDFVTWQPRVAQPAPAAPAPRAPAAAPARPAEPAPGDYPDVEAEILRPEPLSRPRQPSAAKAFAARLTGEAIVFSIHMALCLALLLTLRAAAGFDIYRIFGFTQP
ncbi:MAG: FHA domain-containing protein [Planctomycetota bacterium]